LRTERRELLRNLISSCGFFSSLLWLTFQNVRQSAGIRFIKRDTTMAPTPSTRLGKKGKTALKAKLGYCFSALLENLTAKRWKTKSL
jgi:hypothetical protein